MAGKDFSDVTWREFFDARRNRPGFHSRMADKSSGAFGGPQLKLLREERGYDYWSYGNDEFVANGVRGAREIVFVYAVYRDKVLDDGGTPTAFELPTADGWE